MKERSLLHFMAAMVISILTLISFIVMFATWSKAYADDIIPVFYVLLIPTIILWIGWDCGRSWFPFSGFDNYHGSFYSTFKNQSLF